MGDISTLCVNQRGGVLARQSQCSEGCWCCCLTVSPPPLSPPQVDPYGVSKVLEKDDHESTVLGALIRWWGGGYGWGVCLGAVWCLELSVGKGRGAEGRACQPGKLALVMHEKGCVEGTEEPPTYACSSSLAWWCV